MKSLYTVVTCFDDTAVMGGALFSRNKTVPLLMTVPFLILLAYLNKPFPVFLFAASVCFIK